MWQLLELHNYTHVYWADGNVILSQATDWHRDVVLRMGHADMLLPLHFFCGDILCEGKASNNQMRYRVGRVQDQIRHYIEDRRFPYQQSRHFWMGTFAYRIGSKKVQSILTMMYRELQIWSINDQVVLPYYMWREGLENRTIALPYEEYCQSVLHTSYGSCRGQRTHKTQAYGVA